MIDTATNMVVATVPVDSTPFGVAVNPDGTRVYVANSSGGNTGTISVIDTAANRVATTVNLFTNPFGVVVNPDHSCPN